MYFYLIIQIASQAIGKSKKNDSRLLTWPIVAYWCRIATKIFVNMESGNGLLPESIISIPEAMLTIYQWGRIHL